MKSLLLKNKTKACFKEEYLEYIDKHVYRSKNLVQGKILKITKTHIYFDIGLKNSTKVTLDKFIKEYFKIIQITNAVEFIKRSKKIAFKNFINSLKIGNSFKFIVYELVTAQNNFFIDFEKTLEYVLENKLFFKLNFFKNNRRLIKGYILNTVKGGFSVDIGGLIAFLPNKQVKSFFFRKKKDFLKHSNLFLHKTMYFKVSSINFERKNVVITFPKKGKKLKKKLQIRIKGLEPLRASSLESKPSMSTNSIISARQKVIKKKIKNANKKFN